MEVKTVTLDQLPNQMIKAFASQVLNAGAPFYTCTFNGQKIKVVK